MAPRRAATSVVRESKAAAPSLNDEKGPPDPVPDRPTQSSLHAALSASINPQQILEESAAELVKGFSAFADGHLQQDERDLGRFLDLLKLFLIQSNMEKDRLLWNLYRAAEDSREEIRQQEDGNAGRSKSRLTNLLLRAALLRASPGGKSQKVGAVLEWKKDRLPGESPPRFIERVYGEWLGKDLTRAHLYSLDRPLYKSLSRWLENPDNRLPFVLPTKEQSVDDKVKAAGGDSFESVKELEALAQAMRRRLARKTSA